jgi:dTDP-4-dehydrorhamnose reductase
LELTDASAVAAAVRAFRPDAIVHCAAMSQTGACEQEPQRCFDVNVRGTELLAKAVAATSDDRAARLAPAFLFLSTDWVYAENMANARETDPATGFAAYGRSKREAERRTAELLPHSSLLLRSALIYGEPSPWQRRLQSSLGWMVEALLAGRTAGLFADEFRSPVYVGSVVDAILAGLQLASQAQDQHMTLRQAIGERLLAHGETPVSPRDPLTVNVAGADRHSRLSAGEELRAQLVRRLPASVALGRFESSSLVEAGLHPSRPQDCSMESRRLETWLGVRPLPLREGLHVALEAMQAQGLFRPTDEPA